MSDKLDTILDEVKGLRKDLADFAQRQAAHGADIAWMKKIFAGVATVLAAAVGHLLRKFNV